MTREKRAIQVRKIGVEQIDSAPMYIKVQEAGGGQSSIHLSLYPQGYKDLIETPQNKKSNTQIDRKQFLSLYCNHLAGTIPHRAVCNNVLISHTAAVENQYSLVP